MAIFSVCFSFGNNIMVNSVCIQNQDTSLQFTNVRFNVSWDNSWRNATNYDAAWIFIKFRIKGQSLWNHASIHTTGYTASPGSSIYVASDKKGAFIYRNSVGSGSTTFTNTILRWDYGIDGVNKNDSVDIFIGAIEMVYIPQGSFSLGDGETANLNGHFESATSGTPFVVTSENAIVLGGGSAGSLGNNNRTGAWNNGGSGCITPDSQDDFDNITTQNLPPSFPKGFNSFYCMKYELTQQQYVDFLNHISSVQSATRYSYSLSGNPTSHRYNISGTYPNFSTTTPYLTCTYIEFYDAAAYADWAALRPMTELEFEKACRGSTVTVTGEYAWGNATIVTNTLNLINVNLGSETFSTGYSTTVGNAWYNPYSSISSPVRAGSFAACSLNTGRVSAGASYWGVMELSGNCWERCVSVGHPKGRAFQGTHGDGYLSSNGGATNSDWPGYNYYATNNEVDGSVGAGYRGGGFDFPAPIVDNLRTSSRTLATAFWPNARYYDDSFRAVRTAP